MMSGRANTRVGGGILLKLRAFREEIKESQQKALTCVKLAAPATGLVFVEGIRKLSIQVGAREQPVHYMYGIHAVLGASSELEADRPRNAVRELRGFGIIPDGCSPQSLLHRRGTQKAGVL